MSGLIKFCGGNGDIFHRECADGLDARAQIIVPETHTALLVKDGVVAEALPPGRHYIFGGTFLGLRRSARTVDIIYISRSIKLPMLWGTRTPFRTVDAATGAPVTVGMNGELEFRVKEPKRFYLELVGTDGEYSADSLKKRIAGRLINAIEPTVLCAMRDMGVGFADFAAMRLDISAAVHKKLFPLFDGMGLELCSFCISGAVIPEWDMPRMEGHMSAACAACGTITLPCDRFCRGCGRRLL